MQTKNPKYEKYVAILKSTYPEMKHLTMEEYNQIVEEINSGNKKAVKKLYLRLLPSLKYATLAFSRTNLNQKLFIDFINEVSITLMEKYKSKADDWFESYNSYTTSNHRIVDCLLEDFVKANSKDLTIKDAKTKKEIKLKKCRFEYLPEDIPEDSEELFKTVAKDLLYDLIRNTINNLSHTRKMFIIRFFGLNGEKPMTLSALAEEYGFTIDVVRGIVSNALRELRHPKNSRSLRDFYEL